MPEEANCSFVFSKLVERPRLSSPGQTRLLLRFPRPPEPPRRRLGPLIVHAPRRTSACRASLATAAAGQRSTPRRSRPPRSALGGLHPRRFNTMQMQNNALLSLCLARHRITRDKLLKVEKLLRKTAIPRIEGRRRLEPPLPRTFRTRSR